MVFLELRRDSRVTTGNSGCRRRRRCSPDRLLFPWLSPAPRLASCQARGGGRGRGEPGREAGRGGVGTGGGRSPGVKPGPASRPREPGGRSEGVLNPLNCLGSEGSINDSYCYFEGIFKSLGLGQLLNAPSHPHTELSHFQNHPTMFRWLVELRLSIFSNLFLWFWIERQAFCMGTGERNGGTGTVDGV